MKIITALLLVILAGCSSVNAIDKIVDVKEEINSTYCNSEGVKTFERTNERIVSSCANGAYVSIPASRLEYSYDEMLYIKNEVCYNSEVRVFRILEFGYKINCGGYDITLAFQDFLTVKKALVKFKDMSHICDGDLIPVIINYKVFNVKCGKTSYLIDANADIEKIGSVDAILCDFEGMKSLILRRNFIVVLCNNGFQRVIDL